MKSIDRHIHLASKESCTGCAACVSACPKQCIQMREDREGFLQPKINTDNCIYCHKCETVCPILNVSDNIEKGSTTAYAVINKDESVRMRSSSGGFFNAIARWVISNGGVVFGVKFDDDFYGVHHDFTESYEGIEAFMRSKYIQSRVGDSFKMAKSFLDDGRQVLFSGTPCQIAGLKSFLRRDYDNLITVDLICHGVPSPGVWKKYLKKASNGDRVLNVNFRDKENGWGGFQCVTTTTTTTTREGQMENPFFSWFLKNYCLRKSCYHCDFRTFDRCSDLTIADYWGVERFCPEMYDNKGTSLVFVHSSKGATAFDAVSHKLALSIQSRDSAVAYNRGTDGEDPVNSRRSRFFFFYKLGAMKLANYVTLQDSPIVRIKRRVKNMQL